MRLFGIDGAPEAIRVAPRSAIFCATGVSTN
jgi:hypothetical protein